LVISCSSQQGTHAKFSNLRACDELSRIDEARAVEYRLRRPLQSLNLARQGEGIKWALFGVAAPQLVVAKRKSRTAGLREDSCNAFSLSLDPWNPRTLESSLILTPDEITSQNY